METKAIRVFYRKADNEIVWYHELRGAGEFLTTIGEDLGEIPSKMPDGETPLGGIPEDYACVEESDTQRTDKFLASDDNKVVDGKLVIGTPRPVVEPTPARDLAAEIDELKAKVEKLEK